SRVVANVNAMTLGRLILENVDPTGSTLVTDKWRGYNPIGEHFAKHEQVDHSAGEYVRDGFSTNRLECFYGQLKRSIDGTHHNVSEEHLQRYVDEHDFRYSTCKMSDSARMQRIMDQAEGRRLTYRRVTAV
ncbi:MAG: IS1595 family transposase, partial [Candidatus Dormibacteraceae bacterium]